MEKTALLIFPSQFCCACGVFLEFGFRGLNLPSDFMLYLWRKGSFVWIFLVVCPPLLFWGVVCGWCGVLMGGRIFQPLFPCFLQIRQLRAHLTNISCLMTNLGDHMAMYTSVGFQMAPVVYNIKLIISIIGLCPNTTDCNISFFKTRIRISVPLTAFILDQFRETFC